MAKQNRFYLLVAFLTGNSLIPSPGYAGSNYLCNVNYRDGSFCHYKSGNFTGNALCIPAPGTYECDCEMSEFCYSPTDWKDDNPCNFDSEPTYYYLNQTFNSLGYKYTCTQVGWKLESLSGGIVDGGGAAVACVAKDWNGFLFSCCGTGTTVSSGYQCSDGVKNLRCSGGYVGQPRVVDNTVLNGYCAKCPSPGTSREGDNDTVAKCYIPKSESNWDPGSQTIIADASGKYIFSENCYHCGDRGSC